MYTDDVLVPSKTLDEGIDNVKEVVSALSTAGFRFPKIEYLGVVTSERTIRPSPRKIIALRNAAASVDVKGVRQLLRLASYFWRFIAGFSKIVAPVTNLLRKNTSFMWSSECE